MKKIDYFHKMWPQEPSLFSQRTMYKLDHTERGRNLILSELPESIRRRMTCDNMHLAHKMRFTDEHHFPILLPCNPDNLDFDLYSYNDRNKHRDGK